MTSIVMSFVGSQDPYSGNTNQEGSIVSLVHHLDQQGAKVNKVVLLYTEGTEKNAIETKEWLLSERQDLTQEAIALIAVSPDFSDDPINQLLAVQEARRAIEAIQADLGNGEVLELNGSSGTPAMKSCWSILQATGFAPHSHVWQIRNPKEMKPGQDRIFRNDVNALKKEVDNRVIQRQVLDYNYSGALVSLGNSDLSSPVLEALLKYGYYRISRDFDRAFSSIDTVKKEIAPEWFQEISALRQKDQRAILRDAYFNALIQLKNQKYSDFLISLFGLQENVLKFLVSKQMDIPISKKQSDLDNFWMQIKQVDQGRLYTFLCDYVLPRGGKLRLDGELSRYLFMGILDYFPQFSQFMETIRSLNDYCSQRNEVVHQFVGISEIQDEAQVLTNLRKMMKAVVSTADTNPFDRLNQTLCQFLDRAV